MKTSPNKKITLWGKTVLATAALGGFLLLGGAPRAVAEDDYCQHRIARADHKLHEAVERHGWNSRQAEHARHELHNARENCWSRSHRWWDEHAHRWHTERDWDDHDHDREHQ